MRIIYSTLIIILAVFFSALIIYNIFINLRFKEGLEIPLSSSQPPLLISNVDELDNYKYIHPSQLDEIREIILANSTPSNSAFYNRDSQNTGQIIANDQTDDTIRTCANTNFNGGKGGKQDLLILNTKNPNKYTLEYILKKAKLCTKEYEASLKAKKSMSGRAEDQLHNIKVKLHSQKDINKGLDDKMKIAGKQAGTSSGISSASHRGS
jgi:hypothetical protein